MVDSPQKPQSFLDSDSSLRLAKSCPITDANIYGNAMLLFTTILLHNFIYGQIMKDMVSILKLHCTLLIGA